MNLLKKTGKLLFTAGMCVYAFCLINGITVFDYTASADGGTLSIVGYSIDLSAPYTNAFWDLYTDIEQKAASVLPSGARQAVQWISQLLSN